MRDRTRAPAKVNLRLRVHEREPTGFHRIETLFCALELADEITVDVSDGTGVQLEVEGPDLGPAADNLAVRAARAFLHSAGLERAVAIRLRKRIPAGGGLGGGSSDAAAILRVLDRTLPGALSPAALHELAAGLGSDVPFFLRGDPTAMATGRGDLLTPAPLLPSMPVLLAFPPFPVSTAAAYGWLDEDRAVGQGAGVAGQAADNLPPSGSAALPPRTWEEVARSAVNDFEDPVFRRHPELRVVRDALESSGAILALLSGSGSTLFGVFEREEAAEAAIALLRRRAPEVEVAATRSAAR